MTSRSRASTALSTFPLFRYSATESLSLRLSTAGSGILIINSIARPPTASALAQAHVAPDQLHRARIDYVWSDLEMSTSCEAQTGMAPISSTFDHDLRLE